MEKKRKVKISFYVFDNTMNDYKSLCSGYRKAIRLNVRDYLKLQIYRFKVYSEERSKRNDSNNN